MHCIHLQFNVKIYLYLFFNIGISCFALIEFDLDITVRRNVLTIYSLCFEIDFFSRTQVRCVSLYKKRRKE